jgi:hypothetical protein
MSSIVVHLEQQIQLLPGKCQNLGILSNILFLPCIYLFIYIIFRFLFIFADPDSGLQNYFTSFSVEETSAWFKRKKKTLKTVGYDNCTKRMWIDPQRCQQQPPNYLPLFFLATADSSTRNSICHRISTPQSHNHQTFHKRVPSSGSIPSICLDLPKSHPEKNSPTEKTPIHHP